MKTTSLIPDGKLCVTTPEAHTWWGLCQQKHGRPPPQEGRQRCGTTACDSKRVVRKVPFTKYFQTLCFLSSALSFKAQ